MGRWLGGDFGYGIGVVWDVIKIKQVKLAKKDILEEECRQESAENPTATNGDRDVSFFGICRKGHIFHPCTKLLPK